MLRGGLLAIGAMAATAGCVLMRVDAPLPAAHNLVRDQLVIYSDFELPPEHPLLDELAASRQRLSAQLDLPVSDEPIHVYLFDNAARYENYLRDHYADVPLRRAIFVESRSRLAVYASWGERVAEDLHHEVAHGYLHAVIPSLPLWLDEGLAEYYEVPSGRSGVNEPHVAYLLRRHAAGKWVPDLRRLESLSEIDQMAQQDYAEAWCWVHFLLETSPVRRGVLRDYLARLRTTGSAPPFSQFFLENEAAAQRMLLSHLQLLQDGK